MSTKATSRGGSRQRDRRTLVPGNANRVGLPLAPPVGMGDLVEPQASQRRALGDRLVSTFALYGYDLVATPFFEHADVLERGLEQVDRRDLLRFVEPETGEVALLRPDITPQIARIIATRLRDRPAPWRLCYEGHVIRRRRGRARRQRQIAQTGVECVGLPAPDADVEVIALAVHSCEAVGLQDFRVEIGQVGIGRALLETVPEAARDPVADALVHKDAAALENLLQDAGLAARDRRPLMALTELYGGLEVIGHARRLLRSEPARRAVDELERTCALLGERGLGDRLVLDLGELRGQAYYTGVSFTLLAAGPGQPVGFGGRYDHMLGRFGLDAPATGFALDLGNLTWALERDGRGLDSARPVRVVVGQGLSEVAADLRGRGATVAELGKRTRKDALAFAEAWSYDGLLMRERGAVHAHRMTDRTKRAVQPEVPEDLDALLAWLRARDTNGNED